MSLEIDDLLNDSRLARLFLSDPKSHGCGCALQLWILQIKSEDSVETRIVYGRLLPYSHSSNRWYATDDDDFRSYGSHLAQVVRLNLYVKSALCAGLLRELCAGKTIAEVSSGLNLQLSDQLKARFGTAALAVDELAYHPVTYLLNRDAHDERSTSSPHGSASALSAFITQVRKEKLFHLSQGYDVDLTAWVIKFLNTDTGLDFGGNDIRRFGDLELLVFPALDDHERNLLFVEWTDAPSAVVIRFSPTQLPDFKCFQFKMSLASDNELIYSRIISADLNADGLVEISFELSERLSAIAGSIELEVFGFRDEFARDGVLCCQYRAQYFREIHLTSHMASGAGNPVKFDWLEKASRPSFSPRVKAALTINRDRLAVANRVGGHGHDLWVPANRDLVSLFARLHPPRSEGQFFMRWSQGDGEGRLQFVEWFKALLAKYGGHQFVIFDPYFEDAGIGLLLLGAVSGADYIVFTSLPKAAKEGKVAEDKSDLFVDKRSSLTDRFERLRHFLLQMAWRVVGSRNGGVSAPILPDEGDAKLGESNNSPSSRINNLVASCERNRQLLRDIKLRIYGLKEGRLHDRYILITGQDGLPAAGFNLSNSFQKAAENFPLLVTPIPADVLIKVEHYKSQLIQEARRAHSESEDHGPPMQLLFDSASLPTPPRRYEPLGFFNHARAGDVLGVCAGAPSLKGLSGEALRERMRALELLKDGSLNWLEPANLSNYLSQFDGDFAKFTGTWEVIGEILAHSSVDDYRGGDLASHCEFLAFLVHFLNATFGRAPRNVEGGLTLVDAAFFRKPIETLLQSSYQPGHMFHSTKYASLTWCEYYAVKFLWWHAPSELIAIAEVQAALVPKVPERADVLRLSLLCQIVSEIALSVQFDISERQRDRLLCSSNGLLQWMGLNAIEMQLEKPHGISTVLQLINGFDHAKRVRVLGWMVSRASANPKKSEPYAALVAALHEVLPQSISAEDLKKLVDSLRGHMRQLPWAEPWLFRDFVGPLLETSRASTDDACEIWIRELAGLLEPEHKNDSLLFDLMREGETTGAAAMIFAYSSPQQRKSSLKLLQEILKRQQQIVQKPLASTSDSARWDRALTVSMWILAFARWTQYYLREQGTTDDELEKLAQQAHELAMVRPMAEWRTLAVGTQGKLAAFLDQVEELMAKR